MTHESKHLIEQFDARIERLRESAAKARAEEKWVLAGIYDFGLLMVIDCRDDLRRALPWVEEDARFAQAMGR